MWALLCFDSYCISDGGSVLAGLHSRPLHLNKWARKIQGLGERYVRRPILAPDRHS